MRGGRGRRRDRHPPAAVRGHRVQGPRPARGRRGAALRRRATRSRSSSSRPTSTCSRSRHADPAHARDEPHRHPRPHAAQHAAGRAPADPHLRRRVRRPGRRRGHPPRAAARGPGVLRAQPGAGHRGTPPTTCATSCPRRGSRSPTARWTRARSSRSCSTSGRASTTCSSAPRSSSRGIDMPTVNTLVVDRADLLGLGQLHQLRGRVGRSRPAGLRLPVRPAGPGAQRGGLRAAQDDRRGHRARLGLQDRHARPRDPRRRQPARHRPVRPHRRGRLRPLLPDGQRGGGRAEGRAGPGAGRDQARPAARRPPARATTSRRRSCASRPTAAWPRSPPTPRCDDIRAEWEDRYGPLPAAGRGAARGRPPPGRGGPHRRARGHGGEAGRVRRRPSTARLSPLPLKTSQQIRLKRLHPKAVYKEADQLLIVPVPAKLHPADALVDLLRELDPPGAYALASPPVPRRLRRRCSAVPSRSPSWPAPGCADDVSPGGPGSATSRSATRTSSTRSTSGPTTRPAFDQSQLAELNPGTYPMQLVDVILQQRIDLELHHEEFEELGPRARPTRCASRPCCVLFQGDMQTAEQALAGLQPTTTATSYVDDIGRADRAWRTQLGEEAYLAWRTDAYLDADIEVSPRYGTLGRRAAVGRPARGPDPASRRRRLPDSSSDAAMADRPRVVVGGPRPGRPRPADRRHARRHRARSRAGSSAPAATPPRSPSPDADGLRRRLRGRRLVRRRVRRDRRRRCAAAAVEHGRGALPRAGLARWWPSARSSCSWPTPTLEVEVLPALSFLDLAWARLGVDPVALGVRLVDGRRFAVEAAGAGRARCSSASATSPTCCPT